MKKIIVRKEFYDALILLGKPVETLGFTRMASYILEKYDNGGWNSEYRELIRDWRYEFDDVASGADFLYKIATAYRNPKTGLIEVKEVS